MTFLLDEGLRRLAGMALLLPLGCSHPGEVQAVVTVAAASSLTGVMEEVAALWKERSEVELRCTFGSTSTLARQIENGAPFDVLLSANRHWVEYLAALGRVGQGEPFPLAGNRMVAVAPSERHPKVHGSLASGFAEGAPLRSGRCAMGDPEHVPLGIYAKAALERLGHWGSLQGRVLPAPSARAALRLVERGEADFGFVYRTDALESEAVTIVAELPQEESWRVELVGSALDSASAETRPFLRWLQGPEVRAVFARRGFEVR